MALFLFFFLVLTPALALWPIPTSLHTGSTALRLDPNFSIQVQVPSAPSDLSDAVSRTANYLKTDKLQRLVVGRGANQSAAISGSKVLKTLQLSLFPGAHVTSISSAAVADISLRDESYTLTIPSDGSVAHLQANSTLGLFRGLTTFGQLWYSLGDNTYTVEAPITIKDAPAFPYRGFMLDTARNFFSVDDIKRTLDTMSWVKINTFHWHVVDSQSFPLDVKGFPELAQAGAYTPESIYSTSDVQDVVSYAAARGIDVIVEIDTPGHTAAISSSHPEYVACNQASPWADYANEPPAGQLRLASPAVITFISDVIDAVSSSLPGKYFSTGGDEINTYCYQQDAETQADLKQSGQTFEQALNSFTQHTHGVLAKNGKTPVVWEEMVLEHNVTLSKDTIVMVWISSDDAAAVAKAGFRIVHAPSDYFYLDCGAGEWIGDTVDAVSWCDPFKSWQKIYSFDPLANLTAEQSKLVLGGESLLWTEQSDPDNLDSIAWPRAAVSAEVFWTGANLPDGNPRNVTEAISRLHDVRFRMVQRGTKAIAIQPFWCALRPDQCEIFS